MTVTAIVDPNEALAQKRIDTLQSGTDAQSCRLLLHDFMRQPHDTRPAHCTGEHGDVWANTKVFSSYQAMLQDADAKPDAAFIGLPPKYHGAFEDKSANIEVFARCCVQQSVQSQHHDHIQMHLTHP